VKDALKIRRIAIEIMRRSQSSRRNQQLVQLDRQFPDALFLNRNFLHLFINRVYALGGNSQITSSPG